MYRIIYGACLVITAGILLTGFLKGEAKASESIDTGEVISVMVCDNTDQSSEMLVYVETGDGNTWSFYGDGFAKGDEVRLTFDDKGTEDPADDAIIGATKYIY